MFKLTQIFRISSVFKMDGDKFAYYKEILENEGNLNKWWEIPRESLKIGDGLGSGAFGDVKKGYLTIGEKTEVCAVKMLKGKLK